MLNPTFSGVGDAGPSKPLAISRVYLGSEVLSASGTWNKAAALAQSFLSGVDLASVEIDLECIGGGAAGDSTSSNDRFGGRGARPQWRRGLRLSDLPETASVAIGSGGAATKAPGGASSFGSLLLGPGGAVPSYYQRPDPDLNWDGPGAGAGGWIDGVYLEAQNGARAWPDRATHAGNFGRRAGNKDAESATSPFGYGAGGAASGRDGISGGDGGAGGRPGGGGGAGNSTSYQGGRGGNGAIRLHYYSYRST